MSRQRDKLASDLQGVLRVSAQHLAKLANAHAALQTQSEATEHELMAYKLARRMEQRGLLPELDFDQKVAQLMDTPRGKYATLEQAVELATSGFRLGQVQADDRAAAEGTAGTTPDVLDAFIASQSAYT